MWLLGGFFFWFCVCVFRGVRGKGKKSGKSGGFGDVDVRAVRGEERKENA